eukprot:13508-Heterococcus_DN1.PRE.1
MQQYSQDFKKSGVASCRAMEQCNDTCIVQACLAHHCSHITSKACFQYKVGFTASLTFSIDCMPVIADHYTVLAVTRNLELLSVCNPLYRRMMSRDATPFAQVDKARLSLGASNSAYSVQCVDSMHTAVSY